MSGRGSGRLEQAQTPGGWDRPPGLLDRARPIARRFPQENRRPLSRGYRAARRLDRRLSFAQREQAGHAVTEMVPGRLDPRDLIANGDHADRRAGAPRPRRQWATAPPRATPPTGPHPTPRPG